jgi:hypothetical protein
LEKDRAYRQPGLFFVYRERHSSDRLAAVDIFYNFSAGTACNNTRGSEFIGVA